MHLSIKIPESVTHLEQRNSKEIQKSIGIYFTREMKQDFSKIDIGQQEVLNILKTLILRSLKFY